MERVILGTIGIWSLENVGVAGRRKVTGVVRLGLDLGRSVVAHSMPVFGGCLRYSLGCTRNSSSLVSGEWGC